MRSTERLLEVIEEVSTESAVLEAVRELRRRGDTLVRQEDLRLIATAANHGRRYGSGGDTDYTGFEDALGRIASALGAVD
jgi:hypothetical protein